MTDTPIARIRNFASGRAIPASRIATSSAIPSVRIRSRVKSSRMIPFFTMSPTSRISPMNDETLSGVCVRKRLSATPMSRTSVPAGSGGPSRRADAANTPVPA